MFLNPTPRYMKVTPPWFEDHDGDPPTCHDRDELFFTPDPDEGKREGRRKAARREHEARRICADCPFVVACALHGLEHEEFGVWGGLSERDRKALGGRGLVSTPGPGDNSPGAVLRNLARAGFTENRAKEILLRWKIRRAHARIEEVQRTGFEEVA